MNTMNLKNARESAGFTQSSAAKSLGISDSAYKNYEHGNREPSNELLCKIARLFGVTTDYLLGMEKAPDPFAELDLSTDDEQEVLAKYMSLPENVRAIMLDVLIQLGDAARARQAAEQRAGITETTTAGTLHDRLAAQSDAEETAG